MGEEGAHAWPRPRLSLTRVRVVRAVCCSWSAPPRVAGFISPAVSTRVRRRRGLAVAVAVVAVAVVLAGLPAAVVPCAAPAPAARNAQRRVRHWQAAQRRACARVGRVRAVAHPGRRHVRAGGCVWHPTRLLLHRHRAADGHGGLPPSVRDARQPTVKGACTRSWRRACHPTERRVFDFKPSWCVMMITRVHRCRTARETLASL